MIRNNKKHSTLILAGVSFLALTMATGTAKAGTTVNTPVPGWSLSGNGGATDFILFTTGFSSTDDVIIDEDVTGPPENGTAITLEDGYILGDLIIEDVDVIGYETNSGGGNISATGAGIVSGWQNPGVEIYGQVINDGFVAGYAEAISTADLGAADDAEAFAFGAVFIGDENPNFTNNDDGTVYADAFASAYDTSLAVAGGLIQADGFNGISGATITNAGTIESNAEAKAGKNGQDGDSTSGPYDPSNTEARAWAVSLGAGQLVGDGLAGANFTNLAGADLTVLAAASAIDYSEATAGALGIGGAQIGLGLAGARLYGENDGIIDVEVDARAEIIPFNGNGDTVDTGDALAMGAGVGFLQVGLDVFGTGVADFTNTYEMNVDVYAEALTPVVDGYDAQALGIGLGAGQVIGTLIGNAYAEINNYDEIAVDVLSRATGGDASADSFGIGTLQIAAAGALGTASASLTNTSPDSIDVYAAAYASGLNADANAYVFGAGQVAFNLLGNATADVSNSGGILADAYALADAKYDANADADAAGVNQTVFSLFASDATINSSYYIEANAFAYASSSRSDAYASASASGANQFGVGGTLALNLTNQIGGTIDADATASAFAYETANASADAKGFEQNGTSFAGLSLSADNSGDMYVDALAIASGAAIPSDPGYVSASYAFAEANVAGSIQSGITTSGGLVLAGFGNSGVMDIEADAFAFAAYTAEADAGAFGASQDLASPSGDVYAIIENSGGYLRADAEAYASSFFGAAYASGLAVGAGQDATGRNVFLTASNSTSLRVDADGTAIAYDDWAYAEAQATGVDQEAFATAGRAAVYTENTSSIFVTADSYAVGYYAQAFAYATAIGVAQDADAENGVATAAINNSGIYDITGSAEAIAYSVYDAADAMAFARGVEQYADGGVRAVASVQNAAGIYGTAVAFAVSYDSGASANATGTGVFQDVYSENGTAVAFVSNSSLIQGLAESSARVETNGRAQASATAAGVYQVAASYGLGLYSENAYADLENTGLIAADGFADASAPEGDAFAYVNATAVTQDTYSTNGLSVTSVRNESSLTGFGVIDAYGDASAFAETRAVASADAAGVNQNADAYFGNAYSDVVNDGIIQARAIADAYSLEGTASAWAFADGVEQETNSDYGEAGAFVSNSYSILAGAVAYATGSGASATAIADGIDQEVDGYFDAVAVVENTGTVGARTRAMTQANSGSNDSDAFAQSQGIEQDADSEFDSGDGEAITSVYNEGLASAISAYAIATAYAMNSNAAYAVAYATGIDQNPDSDGSGKAVADVRNEGQVVAWAFTDATNWLGSGPAYAESYALGIEQRVDADGTGRAYAEADNSQRVLAVAKSRANVFSDNDSNTAIAYADAEATAVYQDAFADDNDAQAFTTNSARIEAVADAIAFSAYDSAYVEADAMGVYQDVESNENGFADAIVENDSGALISAEAIATATAGGTFATASGSATAVRQVVYAHDLGGSATVDNDGSIRASASVRAIGASVNSESATTAQAYAWATGVNQFVDTDGGDATATVTNTSFLSIKANAYAEAIATNVAVAQAVVDGVDQEAFGDDYGLVETDNSGLISAVAFAVARTTAAGEPGGRAFAYATASGLDQEVEGSLGSTAYLSNSGELYGVALAKADGASESYAASRAKGHNAMSYNDLTLDITNYEDGEIWAFASADAYDTANARAAGAWFEVFDNNYLEGTIVNAGLISGSAFAVGTSGEAEAFGVVMISDEANRTTMTNTGVISAIAEGPTAYATAIAVASHSEESKGSGIGTATINNDGGFIFAGVIDTNGINPTAIQGYDELIYRGNAINTRGFTTFNGDSYGEAPNAVVFNWTGGTDTISKDLVEEFDLVSEEVQDALAGQNYGYIFGNAFLTPDEVINIKDGVTIFDGILNPDGEFYGELNIYDEGKLVLVQNEEEGAAGGTVQSFNLASDGTLVMELTPYDEAEGFDYSQINAINADVQGTFVALYTAGIYGNTMFYDNIINAENLSVADLVQGFAEVDDNSALLKTTALVDNEGGDTDNIDLYVERLAFNAVAGMTDNQQAAGGAIEKVYGDIDLDTDFGRLVSQLFTLDDGDYQLFMDQLTGAEHAQHLRSVLWSTRAINRIITERMECDTGSAYRSASATSGAKVDGNTVMPTADAPMAATGCFDPGTASVWMRGFGQWNTLDGDENAPGGDETQYGIIFGGDYAFDENWFLGIAGGYFNSDGEFDDWGGRQGTDYDYDGLQLAAYGGYDNSTYYLRGVLSYGNYEGESNRMIAWPGGSPIDPSGDPSSNTFAFYGETGYRFDIGAGNITPFAGLNLATATLESFTEDDPDGTGAALEIHDSDANSIASVLGLRFDADMAMGSGIFTPSVSVAWMHEFGDTPEVDMSFAGAPSGADFTVVASEVARDSILVDAGAKFLLGDSVDFGVYYNGQFNEDYSSNAITARLGYKF